MGQVINGRGELDHLLERAELAMRPFAACVYDDNGDVTVSDTFRISIKEWWVLMRTYKKIKERRGD